MRKRVSSIFMIAAVCTALTVAVFAAGAQAAVRHFDVTVVSKDSAAKTIRGRTEGGAKITFKVNSRTKFDRIPGGFSGIAKGMAIEIEATNASGQWIAVQIEPRSSGGGGEGGGHGGGHDDGPGHH
ncbi:MAG TPA: hypothetical protein VGI17_08970 [Solirubrobacterales bacterium]|jgi:hypothetical protein